MILDLTADDEKKRKSDVRKVKRRMDKHNLMLDIYNRVAGNFVEAAFSKIRIFRGEKKKRNKEELRYGIPERAFIY